jgi:hypothetical protein
MEPRVSKFTFFISYFDAYRMLKTPEEKIAFFEALANYAFYGTAPEIDNEYLMGMLCLAIPNINKSIKNSVKGEANGKKGGAPLGNQNARKTTGLIETTPGLNENKTEKEKDMDMEKGEGNGKQRDKSVHGTTTVGGNHIDLEKIYSGN